MKAIINPWSNVPTRESSHSAGWAKLWSQQLGADIVNDPADYHEYDEFFVYNDINGKRGQFNLFGFKPDNEVGGKIKNKWMTLITLGRPMVDLDFSQSHAEEFAKRGLGQISHTYSSLPSTSQHDRILTGGVKSIVIGDSHALSVTRPHQACLRKDGQTLHGALKVGLINAMVYNYQPTDLVTYFGNIDIRFHLGRQDNPISATQALAIDYVRCLEDIPENIRVRAVELLPNAPDDRKLPGTGLYKGEKFYGDLDLRQELVNEFNNILRTSDIETIPWGGYSTADGLLDVKLMEARQSVHIRPSAYNLGY